MLTSADLDQCGGCSPNPKVEAAPLPELLRAVAEHIDDVVASRRLDGLATAIENPDPHAAEQAVAVAENDAGPNGTPKLSLAEEAAILRKLRALRGKAVAALEKGEEASVCAAWHGLSEMTPWLERLQASNTAYQITAQQDCAEPGDLPETGIDEYEREKDAVELEAPDGRKWISVDTPPEESGTYRCVVRLRNTSQRNEMCGFTNGEWQGPHEVIWWIPDTRPPIPEMPPKYEWSPTTTPVGAVVRYLDHLEGQVRAVVVVEWVDDYVHVRRPTDAYGTWGPDGQVERFICGIELPKPAPIDKRLSDFVRGARGLLGSMRSHHYDYYLIDQDRTDDVVNQLGDAEEAIAGSQAPETPEPDEQLRAGIKELVAVIEMADELAQQAVPVKRFTGHPGDDRVNASSAASEYTVIELHDVALAARVKAKLAEIVGRSDG